MTSKEFLNEKVKFRGILCTLDESSDKNPNGCRGHRIILPKIVAEKYLHLLINSPLNCNEGFISHHYNWKNLNIEETIGIITRAIIQDNKLIVYGYIKEDIVSKMEKLPVNSLGMSYEMKNAGVKDIRKNPWILTKAPFTGAAVLLKSKAAYQKSSFEIL